MDAKEWIDQALNADQIIKVALWKGEECWGRGKALKLGNEGFAVLIEDCGDPKRRGAGVGAIVKFRETSEHGSDQYIILGEPATIARQTRHWN
jgi:hypothetical protein